MREEILAVCCRWVRLGITVGGGILFGLQKASKWRLIAGA